MELTLADLEREVKRQIKKLGRDTVVTIAIGEHTRPAVRVYVDDGEFLIEVDEEE